MADKCTNLSHLCFAVKYMPLLYMSNWVAGPVCFLDNGIKYKHIKLPRLISSFPVAEGIALPQTEQRNLLVTVGVLKV